MGFAPRIQKDPDYINAEKYYLKGLSQRPIILVP